ncbi:tetratricopeptide repeat protein [Galbitalea sp. SE-J8]|uniref:tetratricopeptide repeat protein n=1 Tax=Galbitalea sp. SE-J8 TaxID=3054952 RepID=UPI00259CC936|nr:tetratricopeptide repeat protein [Galbitalea sp. SE-J8]MDM4764094.1 tetratricopeptide repeat protein [Galbitalea sp. SE-J8]
MALFAGGRPASLRSGGAPVAILGAGVATLELSNAARVAYIDRVEGSPEPAGPVRIALEVTDAAAAASALGTAGVRAIAPPIETPWRSINARFAAPESPVQLTVFEELGPDAGEAGALYTEGGEHDSAGRGTAAEPLYRRALELGLPEPLRVQCLVQLASTIRNLGRFDEALALLDTALAEHPADEWTGPIQGFRALALASLGRDREAASVALTGLSTRLSRYSRSLGAYADELLS